MSCDRGGMGRETDEIWYWEKMICGRTAAGLSMVIIVRDIPHFKTLILSFCCVGSDWGRGSNRRPSMVIPRNAVKNDQKILNFIFVYMFCLGKEGKGMFRDIGKRWLKAEQQQDYPWWRKAAAHDLKTRLVVLCAWAVLIAGIGMRREIWHWEQGDLWQSSNSDLHDDLRWVFDDREFVW